MTKNKEMDEWATAIKLRPQRKLFYNIIPPTENFIKYNIMI